MDVKLLPWPSALTISCRAFRAAQQGTRGHVRITGLSKPVEMRRHLDLRILVNRLRLQDAEQTAYEIIPVEKDPGTEHSSRRRPSSPVVAGHYLLAPVALFYRPPAPPSLNCSWPFCIDNDRRCRRDSRVGAWRSHLTRRPHRQWLNGLPIAVQYQYPSSTQNGYSCHRLGLYRPLAVTKLAFQAHFALTKCPNSGQHGLPCGSSDVGIHGCGAP